MKHVEKPELVYRKSRQIILFAIGLIRIYVPKRVTIPDDFPCLLWRLRFYYLLMTPRIYFIKSFWTEPLIIATKKKSSITFA